MQVLLIATVALFVGSGATVAVPKLAGNLIDVCINYTKGSGSERETMQRLNREPSLVIIVVTLSAD